MQPWFIWEERLSASLCWWGSSDFCGVVSDILWCEFAITSQYDFLWETNRSSNCWAASINIINKVMKLLCRIWLLIYQWELRNPKVTLTSNFLWRSWQISVPFRTKSWTAGSCGILWMTFVIVWHSQVVWPCSCFTCVMSMCVWSYTLLLKTMLKLWLSLSKHFLAVLVESAVNIDKSQKHVLIQNFPNYLFSEFHSCFLWFIFIGWLSFRCMAGTIGFPARWLFQKEKLGRRFKLKSFNKVAVFKTWTLIAQ